KRKVRHDRADVFCTTTEGVRGQRALEWGLVDELARPGQFAEAVRKRAVELAREGRQGGAGKQGVPLTYLEREDAENELRYRHVTVSIDRERRVANIVVRGAEGQQPADIAGIEQAGAA